MYKSTANPPGSIWKNLLNKFLVYLVIRFLYTLPDRHIKNKVLVAHIRW